MAQDNQNIRDIIDNFGFAAVGVAPYALLADQKNYLDAWLAEGCHAQQGYLADKPRHDPRIILPDCKSVVVALFTPQIWGYHKPLRKTMKRLLTDIQMVAPAVNGRVTVDTAPILERAWAVRAGLGTVGRNSLLVSPLYGSNTNIATLLLDVVLPYDDPFSGELCPPQCRACIDACPKGALRENRTVDCRICLSYLSQQDPDIAAPQRGCTVCQRHCPLTQAAATGASPRPTR